MNNQKTLNIVINRNASLSFKTPSEGNMRYSVKEVTFESIGSTFLVQRTKIIA